MFRNIQEFYTSIWRVKVTYWGVLLGGIFSILLTRLVFNQYHSDWYERTIPSISKTGALSPADVVFSVTMAPVGGFIIFTWIGVYLFNIAQIRSLHVNPIYRVWAKLVLGLGIAQGVSVSLMALITLEMMEDIHIILSILVFVFGGCAFVAESFLLGHWRLSQIQWHNGYVVARRIFAVSATILGFAFLYLFLEKGNAPIYNRYVTQIVYIANEHLLAFISFSYAPLLLPDVLKFFTIKGQKVHNHD